MSEPLAPGETRIVAPDELPPSTQIPADLDPLADGILMAHQRAWVEDKSDIKIVEKGRRTGLTWCEALDDTVTAASQRSAGGDNVFYVGDTKDKGLEFVGYVAHNARLIGEQLAQIEEYLFEDQRTDGTSRYIAAYRVRFASGFRVQALSSRPENIRGLQGIVVIDEAAFHDDVRDVIEAANALLIWGGKVRIISTHNGAANPFNELIQDVRAGRYPYSLHRVTFDDAVENGLYERVCLVRGRTPTPEGKAEWYQSIRGSYGSNKEGMEQELDCIPRESAGTYLSYALIQQCARPGIPVLRLELPPEFAQAPKVAREREIAEWCEQHLKPLTDRLDPHLDHYLGEDFGRSGDLSVLWPIEQTRIMKLVTPFVLLLRNVPFEQQKQIVYFLIDHLPRFRAGAFDARGNGQYLAEVAMQKYGSTRIAQVMLSQEWYRENMPPMKAAFEDRDLVIPEDADVTAALRAIRMDKGIAKVPDDYSAVGSDGKPHHGDAGIALALACFAVFAMEPAPIEYTPAPPKAGRWDGSADERHRDPDRSQAAIGKGGMW